MAAIDSTDQEQSAVGRSPERSGGVRPTDGPPAATREVGHPSVIPAGGMAAAPDPEVLEKPARRRFNVEYKRRVLEEADACTESGQIGALLRREGLYSSLLSTWRSQREQGVLAGLQPKRRGPKKSSEASLVAENESLRRKNERLSKRLRQAEAIIDIQKRASEILGISLESSESGDDA